VILCPLSPELTDRFVKVRADLGQGSEAGRRYRHSTGFVVRQGIVLTSAHGVVGASSITLTNLHLQDFVVGVDAETVWSGHPEGPAVDKAPDLAVIVVPELGQGLRPFPVARLRRTGRPRTLHEAQVVGFPAFTEGEKRVVFHDEGTISLASHLAEGLIDINLSARPLARPQTVDPCRDVRSQWEGISGAAVFLGKYLVGLVTEHRLAAGDSLLTATPLTLLEPSPNWPSWGPGVSEPHLWWHRLGVTNPSALPVLPGELVRAPWIDDLRYLGEALAELNTQLPPSYCKPVIFGVQAHEALLTSFRAFDGVDFTSLSQRLRTEIARCTARGSSIYGLSTKEVLTARTLLSTLDFVFSVHQTAVKYLPWLLPRLRYRVQCPRIEIDDVDGEIKRWIRASSDEKAAGLMVTRLEITTTRDAYGELLAAFSNADWGSTNPTESVRCLVDLLLATDPDLSSASTEMKPCLLGSRPNETLSMLSATDIEPEVVEHEDKGFLVGEQPTLNHLRHGYFAPSEDLDSLEAAYWEWYQSNVLTPQRRRSGRVPIFWITGPSGAGKSVLLLQFLARLSARAGVSVVWLGSSRERLAEATRQALNYSAGRHAVIGVDDPFVVGDQGDVLAWRETLFALGRQRQSGPAADMPVFVCCSPTEQYDRFKNAHAGDVSIERYVLNPYRDEFVDHLRRWYESRTGLVAESPAVGEKALPAQLFFEWWKGEGVPAFARRFRTRISSRGLPELTNFFERLLAVNRLYVGYPYEAVSALSPEVKDALVVFQRDMHVNLSTVGRAGYWLSHPHLANVIYQEWFPPERTHVRAAHIEGALLDAIRVGGGGWASQALILRLLQILDPTDHDVAEFRVEPQEARTALSAAAAKVREHVADLANPVLASWVTAERCLAQGLGDWQPVVVAMARIGEASEDEKGLNQLVASLVQLRNPDVDDTVWRFLGEQREWLHWTSTAELLVNQKLKPAHVATLVTAVRAHSNHSTHLHVLVRALRANFRDATLVALARDLVQGRLETSSPLAPLAAALVNVGGESESVVLTWLTKEVRRDNGLVLARLLRRPYPPLIAWPALAKWLIKYPLEPVAGAGFSQILSWPRLADRAFQEALVVHLRHQDDLVSSELMNSVRRMLAGDNPLWSILFRALTPAQVRSPKVQFLARAWLARNKSSTAWHWVFVHIARASEAPDAELVKLGRGRLPTLWGRTLCGVVLSAMFRQAGAEELLQVSRTALTWLRDNPDEYDAWGYLTRSVLDATPVDDLQDVTGEVFRWFIDHADAPTASYIIRALLEVPSEPLHEMVLEAALAWLRVDRIGWGYVYLDLLPWIAPDQAIRVGLPWLEQHLTSERWTAVFAAVIIDLQVKDVATLAQSWFASGKTVDWEAGLVWRIVLEEGPCRHLMTDPDFRTTVNAWLRLNGLYRSWWHIWSEMCATDPTDGLTIRVALEADLPSRRQFGVANALRRVVLANPDLKDWVWELLRTSERGPAWSPAWMALADVAPGPTCWEADVECLPGFERQAAAQAIGCCLAREALRPSGGCEDPREASRRRPVAYHPCKCLRQRAKSCSGRPCQRFRRSARCCG
jgi:hypothetical protein